MHEGHYCESVHIDFLLDLTEYLHCIMGMQTESAVEWYCWFHLWSPSTGNIHYQFLVKMVYLFCWHGNLLIEVFRQYIRNLVSLQIACKCSNTNLHGKGWRRVISFCILWKLTDKVVTCSQLVEAFQATLEEVVEADFLLVSLFSSSEMNSTNMILTLGETYTSSYSRMFHLLVEWQNRSTCFLSEKAWCLNLCSMWLTAVQQT